MSNVKLKKTGGTMDELLNKLRKIYYGASLEHLEEIIETCGRCGIDATLKTLEILPFKGRLRVYPTARHYRMVARSHKDYITMSSPKYGPTIEESINGKLVRYPEWCEVIVYRNKGEEKSVPFSSLRMWKECFQKEKDDKTPKKTWSSYPYAMLATATERMALDQAFWELFGELNNPEELDWEDNCEESSKPEKPLEVKKQATVIDLPDHLAKRDAKPEKEEDPGAVIIPIIDQKLLFKDADGTETTVDFEKFGEYWEYYILQIDSFEALETYKKFAKSNEESWRIFSKLNKLKAISLSEQSAQKKKEFGEMEI